ncbi:MAG: DNA polymerase III subunit gamma/tau [Nitrospinae bacterium]|nr:DNA polymerase III subunit gamma/tau [Nitrospinota bacterium]
MEQKHVVSARKFRPQTFSQVVGQQHIVRALGYALNSGRIAHGYLFAGTRGVGKTTTARILAKALNCIKGPTAEPCLECANCKEIAAGTSVDVIEIDGASNRGIENIRELRENARFSPTSSRHKIYIIDEVHQITKDGFNALLKTLEEPPAHVVFIFATTELAKVPVTILSRCQVFEYRSISLADIAKQLEMIAGHEGVEATPTAIQLLARRAKGSMRDAQSLFDQAAAYGGGKVTEEDIQLILGLVNRSTLINVMDAATRQDKASLLELSEMVAQSGYDPALFVEELLETVRDIMAVKIKPENAARLAEEERAPVENWARALDFDEIQRFFSSLVQTMEEMRYSHMPTLNLAMGLLRLSEKRGMARIEDILDRVARAEAIVEKGVPGAERAAPAPLRIPQGSNAAKKLEPNLEPAPAEITKAFSQGGAEDLKKAFQTARPVLIGYLQNATLALRDMNYTITVDDLLAREHLEEPETRKTLEDIAQKVTGKALRQVVVYQPEKKKETDPQLARNKEIESSIKKHLTETPIVQSALEIFGGDIVDVKVRKDGRLNPPSDN